MAHLTSPRSPSAALALLLSLSACGYTTPPSPSHPPEAPPPSASALALTPPASSPLADAPPAPEPVRRTPLADGDGDGVPDLDDACPCQPGDRSENPKESGCPYDAPPRAHRRPQPLEIHATVAFTRGAELSPDTRETLAKVAQIIRENPQIREAQVTGHAADPRGPGASEALARRRAAAVIRWLSSAKGGVAPRLLVLKAEVTPGVPPTGDSGPKPDRVDLVLVE